MSTQGRTVAAIVGAGLMGRWHADAMVRSGVRSPIIIDAGPDRAERLARRVRGTAAASLRAALDADRVTAVHICTPSGTHEPLIREALDAGCHVLVEKPLAASAAETSALLELAARRRVLLCPVHQFLFQRGVARMMARLSMLGAPRQLDLWTCSAGADAPAASGRAEVALEILPHAFALFARLLGASRVAAAAWHVESPVPGELRALATLGDAMAGVEISMGGRPTVNQFRLVAERGTVLCDLFHGFAVEESGTVSRWRKIVRPLSTSAATFGAATGNLTRRAIAGQSAYPGLRELVRAFYEAIESKGPSPISADETMAVAIACDRVRAAATPATAGRPCPTAPTAVRTRL